MSKLIQVKQKNPISFDYTEIFRQYGAKAMHKLVINKHFGIVAQSINVTVVGFIVGSSRKQKTVLPFSTMPLK